MRSDRGGACRGSLTAAAPPQATHLQHLSTNISQWEAREHTSERDHADKHAIHERAWHVCQTQVALRLEQELENGACDLVRCERAHFVLAELLPYGENKCTCQSVELGRHGPLCGDGGLACRGLLKYGLHRSLARLPLGALAGARAVCGRAGRRRS
jgi:hypothetical protein